jgi:tetratricopeptide (TPR) repeat protein
MKRTTVSLFLFLVLASTVRAQASPRRRPIGDQSPVNGGFPNLPVSDPWEALRLRLEASSPTTPKPTPPPHSDHLVPVSQLRIPSKAIKEFERSQKAFHSGDVRTSTQHLQKALQIYPDFIQAHNALGIRFLQLGDYQKALAEHEIALALDPRSAETHQNLSFTLLLLNRYQEAEAEARQALDLDPDVLVSRYVLGRALLGQRRLTPEVIEMLRQSENTFPDASLVLAQIYFTKGQTDQVIAALRRYLRAPIDQDNKQKAECWAAQLSKQPLPAGCSTDVLRPSFH